MDLVASVHVALLEDHRPCVFWVLGLVVFWDSECNRGSPAGGGVTTHVWNREHG